MGDPGPEKGYCRNNPREGLEDGMGSALQRPGGGQAMPQRAVELYNNLLQGEGLIVSLEPARQTRVREAASSPQQRPFRLTSADL